MALQNAGDIVVDVERATAFRLVENPQRMAECIPGCHDLRELGPGRFAAVLTNKVSFMTLSFKVIVEVVNMDAPNGIEARITGEPIGLVGRLAANASLKFTDAGEKCTLIHYSADVGLTGKLGGIGQPVFRAKSARLAKEFADNLKAAIESLDKGQPGPANPVQPVSATAESVGEKTATAGDGREVLP